jgi:hypothetical protein
VTAITALQNHTPLVRANTVPSSRLPTQPPTTKAASIIRKPLRAEAAPAACWNGPTAPLWLQGWWIPCASMNR